MVFDFQFWDYRAIVIALNFSKNIVGLYEQQRTSICWNRFE